MYGDVSKGFLIVIHWVLEVHVKQRQTTLINFLCTFGSGGTAAASMNLVVVIKEKFAHTRQHVLIFCAITSLRRE